MIGLDRRARPEGTEWYVIARDRAKLGACWRPATMCREHMGDRHVRCPGCGQVVVDDHGSPVTAEAIAKRHTACQRVLRLDRYHTYKSDDGKTVC